jgi:hypothetical protein
MELLQSGNVALFIGALKISNDKWLKDIADDSYHRSGGSHHIDPEIGQFAADFVNNYANGFGDALNSGRLTPSQIERRGMMYPEEGFKLAVINGQRQAMKERGARMWRRILHPELSVSGPCAQCAADAYVTHGIDDPFMEFHPNGQCSQQFLEFTVGDSDMKIEIPVPSDETDRTRRRRKE